MKRRIALALLCLTLASSLCLPGARAADHADTPELISLMRDDARITDLFVFRRGNDLVLALCTDPSVAASATEYDYPSDLTLAFHIDHHSRVRYDDETNNRLYGGTIETPDQIDSDITFSVTFKKNEKPRLEIAGLPRSAWHSIEVFAGLRDDPFIRGPRMGRNVAGLVLEMPAKLVLGKRRTILVWASTQIPAIDAPSADMAGRALRSMFTENMPINSMAPRDHYRVMGMVPDVVIYDTSRPAGFPNGRELTDDVVNLVGDPRLLANDAPFPSENDVPFLREFPYLAPPHPPTTDRLLER